MAFDLGGMEQQIIDVPRQQHAQILGHHAQVVVIVTGVDIFVADARDVPELPARNLLVMLGEGSALDDARVVLLPSMRIAIKLLQR